MLKSQAPLPWNVTLFGDKVLEDKISEDEVILKYSGPLLLIEEEKRLGHARRQPCDDRGRDGVGAANRTEPGRSTKNIRTHHRSNHCLYSAPGFCMRLL